jgi:hypothetical protein
VVIFSSFKAPIKTVGQKDILALRDSFYSAIFC